MTISLDDTRSRPGSLVPALYALAVLLDDTHMHFSPRPILLVARQVLCAFPNVSTLRQDLTLPSLPSRLRKKIVIEATVYFSFHDDDDNLVCFPVPCPRPPSSNDDEDLL